MDEQELNLIIDANLCSSCGICVVECPTDALAMIGGMPVLFRPEVCSYCGVCETVCPEEAISLPYRIVVEGYL